MNQKLLGDYGESVAAAYYRSRGYTVVAANWRCREGEVDIIAEKDGAYVFCEVKTRTENAIATPREAVTPAKQKRVMAAACNWLVAKKIGEPPMRFDVVEVYLSKTGKPKVRCIEGAFTA